MVVNCSDHDQYDMLTWIIMGDCELYEQAMVGVTCVMLVGDQYM